MATAARPDYVVSGLLAAGVHLLLLVFLVVGLSWNRRPAEPVVVELWSDPVVAPAPRPVEPPPRPEPRPEPPPEPKPAPPPEPKPAPPPQPKPVPPRAEPKPAPEPKPADIALQAKREKEKALREEQAANAAKAKEAERERLEQQKQVDEQRKRDDDARRKEEDARRLEQDKRNREAMQRELKVAEEKRIAREAAEAEQRAAARAAAQAQKQIDEYTARIREKIHNQVRPVQGVESNPQAEFEVKLLKSGTVAVARLVRPSGVPAYDKEVERAIYAAQPLPTPEDMEIFEQMRDLKLVFRPKD